MHRIGHYFLQICPLSPYKQSLLIKDTLQCTGRFLPFTQQNRPHHNCTNYRGDYSTDFSELTGSILSSTGLTNNCTSNAKTSVAPAAIK